MSLVESIKCTQCYYLCTLFEFKLDSVKWLLVLNRLSIECLHRLLHWIHLITRDKEIYLTEYLILKAGIINSVKLESEHD